MKKNNGIPMQLAQKFQLDKGICTYYISNSRAVNNFTYITTFDLGQYTSIPLLIFRDKIQTVMFSILLCHKVYPE